MMGKIIDRVGQRYGRLIVTSRAKPQWKHSYWRCKCDCGVELDVRAQSLVVGNTKSCGCLRTEKTIERNMSKNKGNDP